MAGVANSDTTSREAALRRVAIVLSSLPASAAAKLLGTIDQDAKQIVRRTMASLSDVDPLERHRALVAFKASVQHSPADDIDSFQSSSAASIHQRSLGFATSSDSTTSPVLKTSKQSSDRKPSSPLEFLADVEDDSLVDLLAGEHSQAVALVLASVAPAQAARLLPRLAPELRSQALSRLGRLGEIPDTAVQEIADHFRDRVQRQQQSRPIDGRLGEGTSSTGQRALDAILAAMPKTTPVAKAVDPIKASKENRISENATNKTQAAAVPSASYSSSSDAASAVDAALAIRLAPETVDRGSSAETPTKTCRRTVAVFIDRLDRPAPAGDETGRTVHGTRTSRHANRHVDIVWIAQRQGRSCARDPAQSGIANGTISDELADLDELARHRLGERTGGGGIDRAGEIDGGIGNLQQWQTS